MPTRSLSEIAEKLESQEAWIEELKECCHYQQLSINELKQAEKEQDDCVLKPANKMQELERRIVDMETVLFEFLEQFEMQSCISSLPRYVQSK